jgi:phage antirepressor YoqD-like protein
MLELIIFVILITFQTAGEIKELKKQKSLAEASTTISVASPQVSKPDSLVASSGVAAVVESHVSTQP